MTVRVLVLSAALAALAAADPAADERFVVEGGRTVVRYLPMEERFRNPWPAEWEAEFVERSNARLKASDIKPGVYGNTYFENEKQSYPAAFIGFMKGDRDAALKFLQAEDGDPWNDLTLKVDWFPCFTIRSQVRKYFFFGQYLTPEYRKTMFDSAKLWTEVDPLRRPNKHWKQQKEGWTPHTMNSWVDVRATDNLRAMRECAIYVMAEETGNEAVRKAYAERIRAYVNALYTTGMGEWDSANYMGHTMVGYLQLYDYAKDPEVKLLAKGALDWLAAAAAVKYYRGSWIGPNKRDYNNVGPYAGVAGEAAMWFGECPLAESKPYRDWIFFTTSPYRPPHAVVALAHKQFPKPVEILASKPSYEGWFKKQGGEDQPDSFETMTIGETWQMGSLSLGHQGDANGFRLGTFSSTRGADTWIIATALKGYKGIATGTVGGDQVAQCRNLLIWLNANPAANIHLALPPEAAVENDGGVTFLRGEKTWIALHPLNLKPGAADGSNEAKKAAVAGGSIWTAPRDGAGPIGLCLEVGDEKSHGAYDAFKAAVKATSRVDASRLAQGTVSFTGASGASVGITLAQGGHPAVVRNGKPHDWKNHWALYAGADGAKSPITLGWKQGVLTVEAGGRTFTGTMADGKYRFENK